MKKSISQPEAFFTHLMEESRTRQIVIIGTGTYARDMRQKLELLDVPVAFLVGCVEDTALGVRHYRSLEVIEDIGRYFFLYCCEEEERDLFEPVQQILNQKRGYLETQDISNRMLMLNDIVMASLGGGYIDGNMHRIFLDQGKPYRKIGTGTYRVHLFGGCSFSGRFHPTINQEMAQQLYDCLAQQGLEASVYAWGQPNYTLGSTLLQLLRNGLHHRPDHVILFFGTREFRALEMDRVNLLRMRSGLFAAPFAKMITEKNTGPLGNGVDHNIDNNELITLYHQIIILLAEKYEFKPLTIIGLATEFFLGAADESFGPSRAGAKRAQARKSALLAKLDPRTVLDCTSGVSGEDLQEWIGLFLDDVGHLSSRGVGLTAQLTADKIIAQCRD